MPRPDTHPPHSLNEQHSATARECIAVLLGFACCEHATGFRVALSEIAPLRQDFTIGEALHAYMAHIAARMAARA